MNSVPISKRSLAISQAGAERMSVDVEFSQTDDIWVCRINESIELFLVEELRAFLLEKIENHGMRKVIFRMDNVPFIDSSGLGAFMSLKYRLGDRVEFRFCELRNNVNAVFSYTNLLSQFGIDDTLEDSIKAISDDASTN
jgi:anti-anti-sigma factor